MLSARPPTTVGFAVPSPITCPGSALSPAADPLELRAAGRALARLELVDGPLDTPCWIYAGGLQSSGYGTCTIARGRYMLVHRLMYRVLVGPIPAGLELDHLCRRRACANPAHLDPVTHAVNQARTRPTHCGRGHELAPANVRRGRDASGRKCRRCERDRQRLLLGHTPDALDRLERRYQERIAA